MNDPKATLLQSEWSDYTLVFGKKRFRFVGGEARAVPTAVALALRRIEKRDGTPMFKIEDMPVIVTPTKNEEQKAQTTTQESIIPAATQNGLGEFKQGSLLQCLS
jgi:hypothetical protein